MRSHSILRSHIFMVASMLKTDDERLTRLSDNAEFYTLVKRSAPEYPRRAQRIGKKVMS